MISSPRDDANRLVIGVTGHRFLADIARLRQGVSEALEHIARAYPGRPFAVLSPLAEGADRLVAEEVLREPGARLIVPLPLSQEDYMTDFASTESKAEFIRLLSTASEVLRLPPVETREAAYAAVGRYIVEHCDVLIAIWDGQDAQGQGGTAEVVAMAREQNKPLVVVRAGNRKPGTQEPTSLGNEQGRVIVERLVTV